MKELRKKDKELLQFVNSLADIFEKSKTPITETIIAVGRRDNNLILSILDKLATKIEEETYTENREEAMRNSWQEGYEQGYSDAYFLLTGDEPPKE